MSRSPYMYIEAYNKYKDSWEKVKVVTYANILSSTTEPHEIDVWSWNGTHDVFEILTSGGIYPNFKGIHKGLPINVSKEVKERWEGLWEDEDFFRPSEDTPFYFNLADAKLYVAEYPELQDYYYDGYDEDGNLIEKLAPNPLLGVVNRVESILSVWEEDWDWFLAPSDIRVVGWIL